jgi:hypothetical protein
MDVGIIDVSKIWRRYFDDIRRSEERSNGEKADNFRASIIK